MGLRRSGRRLDTRQGFLRDGPAVPAVASAAGSGASAENEVSCPGRSPREEPERTVEGVGNPAAQGRTRTLLQRGGWLLRRSRAEIRRGEASSSCIVVGPRPISLARGSPPLNPPNPPANFPPRGYPGNKHESRPKCRAIGRPTKQRAAVPPCRYPVPLHRGTSSWEASVPGEKGGRGEGGFGSLGLAG